VPPGKRRVALWSHCQVALPSLTPGTVEYYLEAALDGGQKLRWPATARSINQPMIAW